ncbi:IclR family transcriptional regulator [Plastoroseomonas hellenica]|uniref:IclR family transcriptional regulator n=1 Tax=Plastoroseomonas hellenica TaxID=2687306 RepID=UPI001BA59FDE|nr:helix-turn-helix domain-containing protein [Plastoroseomonas hellenica]MBR0641613.1 helix-turn-helix domain-containing protein [Plastoroseomonas hellenica]
MAAGFVKSAQRTLEVLEYFAATHHPAGVGEIARELGYPQSSTSVLLGDLARLGYLEQDGMRRYRPTLRVMLLGGWLQDRLIGDGSLLRRMEQLRARHQVTVLIGMQAGARVRYILTLRRPGADATMRAGMMRPIGRAAVGKALLMLRTEAEAQRILRRANAEEAEARRVDVADVLEDISASRRRGWTESGGAVVPGQNVLAMPLPAMAGQPPMAIGLGALGEEVERQRPALVAALRETCAGLRHDADPAAGGTGGTQRRRR